MILGRYTLPNLMTFTAAALSLMAAVFAAWGHLPPAMLFLLYAGVFDSLDGPLARRLHLTPEDKQFGGQLDTLVDLTSFGFAPALISYSLGLTAWSDLAILYFYLACAMIRLSHFTVHGTERKEGVTYFHGMPSTYACFIFPIALGVASFLPSGSSAAILRLTHLAVGILFILNIPVRDIRSIKWLMLGGLVAITAFWVTVLLVQ